jgi:ABC-type glycerol-3-phosphate transport system substrate-binding protein
MTIDLKKYRTYIIVTIIFLSISFVYRLLLLNEENKKFEFGEENKNKKIVTLWLIEGPDTETRKFQVDKFNREHEDIFIDFNTYKEDYFNMLRIALASDKKVDIFQYGYYEMLKNKNLMNIDDLNINRSLINENNLAYFEGKPYGVKIFGNNVKLLWNKEIFKNAGLNPDIPPRTWEELINFSKTLKEKYPNIIPFEFPASTWGELKATVGEVAANRGPIYTTFWNYAVGGYQFNYSKDILEKLKYIYSYGYTSDRIDKKSSENIRRDFYDRNVAMAISTFEDKKVFSNVVSLSFPVGISDLPKLSISDTERYYFTENYTTLVANNNIEDAEAVKKVFEWLLSESTNREIFLTNSKLPSNLSNTHIENDKYEGYNDISKFQHETLDPTIFTNYGAEETKELMIDAIIGRKEIDDVVTTLNNKYYDYYKSTERDANLDFSNYIMKK